MISKQDIEHLSKLARIDVKEGEKRTLASDLEAVLKYVAALQKVEIGDEAFHHFAHLKSNLRIDESNDRDTHEKAVQAKKLIEAGPREEKGYVKVKSILDK